jgi:hypothetical protein
MSNRPGSAGAGIAETDIGNAIRDLAAAIRQAFGREPIGEREAAATALMEFADLIDRGPNFPLRPSLFSGMARERAADIRAGVDRG